MGHPSLLERDFEKYMDRVIKLFNNIPEDLKEIIEKWEEYDHLQFKFGSDLYWKTDHMFLLKRDIKRIIERVEEEIQKYYHNDEIDFGFLDLVRRGLHGLELLYDNEGEIRRLWENRMAR